MAEEKVELDEAGNPKSEPVTKLGDDNMPVEEKADTHRHDWQGMLQNGRKLFVCAWCGKEKEDAS
jgi:hypothetical protein